jgi:hypothetical protein
MAGPALKRTTDPPTGSRRRERPRRRCSNFAVQPHSTFACESARRDRTWQSVARHAACGALSSPPAAPMARERAIDARALLRKTDLIQSDSDRHFLHTSVLLRHANGDSGEAERQIETILTKAAVTKRRVWVSSILFAELRPSMFVCGRFATLFELMRYIRSLVTLVAPDPNTMMRAARLRDAKRQRPAGLSQADEKPRSMSLSDAIQIASAL